MSFARGASWMLLLAGAAAAQSQLRVPPPEVSQKSAKGETAPYPTLPLAIRHVDDARTPCQEFAAHKPCSEDGHWQACFETESLSFASAKRDAFRAALQKLVASMPQEPGKDQGQVFSSAALKIRPDPAMPFRIMQALIQDLSTAGFYKIECVGPKAAPGEGGQAAESTVAMPATPAAAVAPAQFTVAVVFHRDAGQFVRELRVPVRAGPDGDQLLSQLLAAVGGRPVRPLTPASNAVVLLDVCPEAPWANVSELIDLIKRAGFEKFEFVPPRDAKDR